MFSLFKRQTPAQRLLVIERKLPALRARYALLADMLNKVGECPRSMFDDLLNLQQTIVEMEQEQVQIQRELTA